jgi:2-dehydropantoate 2-reductase
MRILVLGAGGVGGYFGGRLLQSGADVTFLVRSRRAAQIAAAGLVVRSPFGDFTSAARTVSSGAEGGPYDAVLLSCKAYDLASAMDAIAPAVGPGTMIVPLLNGIGHLDTLDARFGRERVVGGIAYIAATLTTEGEVRHLNKVHGIVIGERDACASKRCQALADLFARTPVNCRASDSIMVELWEKFAFLATLAGMTCLMRAPVGAIVATDEGEALMLEMFDACNRTAVAAGHAPRSTPTERGRAMLTERGSAFTASMLRDLERGGPTEADHVLGDMLRRSRALGVDAPLMRVACAHLQAYERARTVPGAV